MPLSHSQGLDQLSFGVSDSFAFFNEMRPKRKLEIDGAYKYNQMEAMGKEQQMDGPFVNPKRLCLDQIKESQTVLSPQNETLPGCLNDTVKSSSGERQESQAVSRTENLNIFDMEEDHTHQEPPPDFSGQNNTTTNTSDPVTIMETDFVPDSQQYNLSPPHTPTSSKGTYCSCITCKGLKPSPVTGRMHCHCYASWRGMYGIDCSFYNDYY